MKKFFAIMLAVCLFAMNGFAFAAESVKLVTWGGGDAYRQSTEVFNGRQDNVEFTIEIISAFDEYISAHITAGDLPEMYNITPYADVQEAAAAGRLMDLSDTPVVASLLESTKASVSYDGKVYALPYQQQIIACFYNPELFEQAGIEAVPTTYSEFVTVCEKLTAAGIQPIASTYASSWTLSHMGSALFSTAIRGTDEAWLANIAAGGSYADTPNLDEIFRFLDLLKQYSGENYMDSNSDAGYNAFAAGKAAILIQGDWALENASKVNPEMNAGMFALPVSDEAEWNKLAIDVSVGIAVNADLSEEKKTAVMQVLEYLYDADDPTGHNSIAFSFPGAGVSAVAFTSEVVNGFNYYNDYLEYAQSGNVFNWIYQQLPAGTDIGAALQGYMAGLLNQEEVIAMLDDANASLTF